MWGGNFTFRSRAKGRKNVSVNYSSYRFCELFKKDLIWSIQAFTVRLSYFYKLTARVRSNIAPSYCYSPEGSIKQSLLVSLLPSVSSGRMREYQNSCIHQARHPRFQSIFGLNLPVRQTKGEGGYQGCLGFTLLNLSCPMWQFRTLLFQLKFYSLFLFSSSLSFLLSPIFPLNADALRTQKTKTFGFSSYSAERHWACVS